MNPILPHTKGPAAIPQPRQLLLVGTPGFEPGTPSFPSQCATAALHSDDEDGRRGRIRTSDPSDPNGVTYQTCPHADGNEKRPRRLCAWGLKQLLFWDSAGDRPLRAPHLLGACCYRKPSRETPPVVGDFGDSFVAWASVDNAVAAVDSGLSLCDEVVTMKVQSKGRSAVALY